MSVTYRGRLGFDYAAFCPPEPITYGTLTNAGSRR